MGKLSTLIGYNKETNTVSAASEYEEDNEQYYYAEEGLPSPMSDDDMEAFTNRARSYFMKGHHLMEV